MNIENTIQLAVTVVTAIITLSYLWKTRVIGADKELLNKYKGDSEDYKKKHDEYKSKYEKKRAEYDELKTQYDMNLIRLTEANSRLKVYENQPYWPNNHSLEVDHVADQTIQG